MCHGIPFLPLGIQMKPFYETFNGIKVQKYFRKNLILYNFKIKGNFEILCFMLKIYGKKHYHTLETVSVPMFIKKFIK